MFSPPFPFTHPAAQTRSRSQGPAPLPVGLTTAWAPWVSKAGHRLRASGDLQAHLSLHNVDYCGAGEWWAFFLFY